MKKKNLVFVILSLVLASFVPGYSQTTSNGDIDIGFYQISGYTLSNKYLEYRDYKEGIVLNSISYLIGSKIGFLEVNAKGIAKNDQTSTLRLGKYGRYYLGLSWDQIPHSFSNHSKLFFTETQKGVYILADSIQARLQAAASDTQATRLLMASYLTQAQRFPLSYRRDKAIGEVKISPTRDIDLKLSYSNEKRKGYKATSGTPNFFNMIELPEPIDFLTHQVDAQAQYSQKSWSIRGNVGVSVFDNKLEALIWDNPFRLTDTTGGVMRSSKARMGVAPDNWAGNSSITGFVKLPYFNIQSRATLGYGIAKQDEKFLPHTINSAIADPNSQLVLPKSSLDGEIRTLTGSYFVSAQPIKKLSLEGNFRYYEFDNQTEEIIFPGRVAYGDYQLDTLGRASLPYDYTKREYGIKANVKPISYVSGGLGYKYERLTRAFRNVNKSGENSFIFSLDLFPVSWVTVRNSYTRSERKAKTYNPDAVEETYPEGEVVINPHLEELRRFDQADRDRDKFVSQASVQVLEKVDLALGAQIQLDDYPKSSYGVKEARSTALSVGVNFYPVSRFSFYGDYTREFLFTDMQSRLRNVVIDTIIGIDTIRTGTDSVENDWGTKVKDLTDVFSLGFLVDVIPQKLSWQANYTYSYSWGRNDNYFTPGGAPAGNAAPWPITKNELQFANSFIRYKISENVSVWGEYRFEKYFIKDFAIDDIGAQELGVNNQGIRSVFLAATQPDYEGHLFGLKLSYQF